MRLNKYMTEVARSCLLQGALLRGRKTTRNLFVALHGSCNMSAV